MRLSGNEFDLSATDLSNFLSCRHRTALEMAEARGKRHRPAWNDPLLDILIKKGIEHEGRYVRSLEAGGKRVVDLNEVKDRDAAVAQTLDAMRSGADLIVQAALCDGRWYGRPDVMRRIETPSKLGAWSYEIDDTKLSRETRAGTILQLGLYSEMLATAQGKWPEYFSVITPDPAEPVHRFRVDDYAAYFRLVRTQMRDTVTLDDEVVGAANYPEPVDHCDVCPWSGECVKKRHKDDHLSLVAGISRLQRRELESRDVATLADLAKLPVPLVFKPKRGSAESYVKVREQARVQFESRGKNPPLHELRLLEGGKGLSRLPEPSPGDVFLDLEGDFFAVEGGREYLFGVVTIDPTGTPNYRSFWAFTDQDERLAFESVIDLIVRSWEANETMHVYHYAPYEPTAFKRLMGRYATREEELDRLLRAERLVDLYAVVRQGVRAGIERYSIKNLEVLYGFTRSVPLIDANRSLLLMEQALELQCPDAVPEEVRKAVEGYNKDDCVSTLRLRDWLEKLRAETEAAGTPVPRPAPKEGDPSEKVDERAQRVDALRRRLLNGVSEAPGDRTEEQHARWLLAYLLDWHRREDKAGWWEYFRLRDLPEEELFDEPQAIAGLGHVGRVEVVHHSRTGKPTGSVVDRYRYPPQEMEIRPKDELKLQGGEKLGDVVRVDRIALTIDVRKGPTQADHHPTSAFAHTHVPAEVLEEAIYRMGEKVADDGVISGSKTEAHPVGRQLLLARPPRLCSGKFVPEPAETAVDFAVRIAADLDKTVLAIQGPPGSGKTFSGARMICALVGQGKKIGVTATSHKVIRNLLDAVSRAAKELGLGVRLAHKGAKEDDEETGSASPVAVLGDNSEALDALRSGEANVLGGTAWLWARPEFAESVDVLFVDEAGQMSLANVLAVSHAGKSVVLLGDPQQLEQPQKGSHPEGVDASALQHILGQQKTITPARGIFLGVTWRLPPDICLFTSELFYESRLESKPGLERQCLTGTDGFDGSGLWVVDVEHDGNCNSSLEEIDVVADLVARLQAPGTRWIDEHGKDRQVTSNDILVIAPYNAQVSRLIERLDASGVRVGTVDRFQGQEAPVVIYSMATSRPEDAPRGMEFLYSPNRLNVATSRARCASILVASPRLFEPDCRTPRQMQLANALCRYRELARPANAVARS
ncbi:MAG: TM0106 family RecB-like putative nuclease [Acidobacteriota bacterium]|nr:TM0106 family RecB-like putative nuclease [Acidobacteriota bacterium]